MIDGNGRLFGLINLVDLGIVLALVFSAALGVSAYRVFQMPAPVIERIEPPTLQASDEQRVRIVGRNFRHYLRVFASPSGTPLAVTPTSPAGPEVPIEGVAADGLDVRLAGLAPGAYDLYVFDNARELAHLSSAVTITPTSPPRAAIQLLVRFLVSAETAGQIHPGDRDAMPPDRPSVVGWEPAEVEKIDVRPGTVDVMDLRLAQHAPDDRYLWMGTHTSQVIADAVVRVPVVETSPGWWEYNGHTVRAGEDFFLQTAAVRVRGTIVHRGEPERAGR